MKCTCIPRKKTRKDSSIDSEVQPINLLEVKKSVPDEAVSYGISASKSAPGWSIEFLFVDSNKKRVAFAQSNVNFEEAMGKLVKVRGKGYIPKLKAGKVPSKKPLYKPVSVHSFRTKRKVSNFLQQMKITCPKDSKIPFFLIINTQIPQYKPRLKVSDGESVSLVQTFNLNTRKFDEPSFKLFENFYKTAKNLNINSAEDREMVNRLKNIIFVRNDMNLGLMQKLLLPKYNGTPWLIRYFLTDFFFDEEKNAFEISVDYHRFRYSTLKLGHLVFNQVKNSVLDCAFVIEGRETTELPERLLTNNRIFNFDMDKAMEIQLDPTALFIQQTVRSKLDTSSSNRGSLSLFLIGIISFLVSAHRYYD
eukprot:snap_masked-scaffold_1-processed-gene-17.47-mRNA-1 protein AED:1.00 eAED:1.00 QI:0/0/0/0/1/1/2/0/362